MLYPTNGLTPELIAEQTERILRDCPRSVIAVKLSLDGVGEAHDRLRGTPGSFAKVIETYERLAPLLDRYPQFELGVNTVFCRANQDHMDGIADFVARLKRIRTHTVSLVRGELADAGYKQVDLGSTNASRSASGTSCAAVSRRSTPSAARVSRRRRTSCNGG